MNMLKLGFGLMRLPKNEDGSIDIEQTTKMADLFIEAGGKYFDTAYVYDHGDSEKAFKKAVAERYPRDAYYLATKLMAGMPTITDEKQAKDQLAISLERTGAGYFDFYLLHAISDSNVHKYDDFGIWDFVKQKKEEGLIRHYGFSYHGTPELLDELLTKHPDVEFVQLQINYADWESAKVQSRRCYEVVRKHDLPLTIMEPIKGGSLANPMRAVRELFDAYNKDASYASWAVRYVASKEGIITVLSGMSNLAQMEDNLSYMKDFKPLNEEEIKIIEKAQEIYNNDQTIKCTACHYCTEGCPMSIGIPDIFALYNAKILDPTKDVKDEYLKITENKGKASDCIQCGQCEGACPQHLPIIDLLVKCREME
ncbi:MAG: aldo/keto reductase [Erysipelotrichaceae bacterium]|nr:aldo/keto reductase [Erysipelotrichaceae bacterium]